MRERLGVLLVCLQAACGSRVVIGGQTGDAGPSQASSDGGTAPASADGSFDPCASIEQQSIAIRQRSCAQCHGPLPPSASYLFDDVLDDSALVTTRAPGLMTPLVIPGQPSASPFFQRVDLGISGGQLGMPPAPSVVQELVSPAVAATVVYPTSEDESILYEWIFNCLGVNGSAGIPDASYGPSGIPDASAIPDSSAIPDASGTDDAESGSPVVDSGPVTVDASPPPPGLAGFALVVDAVLQTPLTCPSDNWEFNVVDALGISICGPGGFCAPPASDGGLGGVRSAVIVNTGQVPIAYTARSGWSVPYPPGVPTGEPDVLVGVIAPGGQADIRSVYAGGVTAILGSSEPFSEPDAGKYVGDEGVIPWPGGVAGSQGSSQMWTAQIDAMASCAPVTQYW